MLPQVALILLGVLVAGIVLVFLGLRGRRIDDHPVCRWCWFDLSGCAPDNVTCPECGAGLKREGAVRIGQRRRIYTAVVLGSAAILAPTLAFGFVAYALATATDINSFKPVS